MRSNRVRLLLSALLVSVQFLTLIPAVEADDDAPTGPDVRKQSLMDDSNRALAAEGVGFKTITSDGPWSKSFSARI